MVSRKMRVMLELPAISDDKKRSLDTLGWRGGREERGHYALMKEGRLLIARSTLGWIHKDEFMPNPIAI